MAAAAADPPLWWGAYERLRWWLVDNPTVSSFEWSPGRTLGASVPFVATAVATYLAAVLVFRQGGGLLPLPSPPPAVLRLASAAHNVVLLVLSAVMAAGCALSALTRMPSPRWLFCFPPSPSPSANAAGPVFFWAHVFYLSKLYELADTLLILLSGEGGRRRLTFLHVYHHAVVVVMCYVWLAASQSLVPIALVTNAAVHVVMYGYYLSSSLGRRWPPRWKRAVTEIQIAQFVFSFAVSLVFLCYHFRSAAGCRGMSGWLFNAVFNVSLLALFLNFHTRAYPASASPNDNENENENEKKKKKKKKNRA
ncbi:putative elongation of fatty acids protein [Ananas comosus]|uniref:very-long-chain 3-oxoacyl-CoA synthase n=1 Tax=Ananas comosus TaxID=4615 RepID=A0A199UZG3_ANACO|nr:putative elongation of fatty acids protein [Ananas comosus]